MHTFDNLWNYDDPAGSEAQFRALLPSLPAEGDDWLELLTQIARAQGLQGQFEAAHHTLDEVQQGLATASLRVRARYWLERGRVFNSARHPAEAAPLFQAALETAQAAGEDFYAVDAAHMLGICLPPDEQAKWTLLAIELAEQSTQPQARGWLSSLYNNLAWTFHDQGRFAQALELFEKALRLREAQGKPGPIQLAKWSVARALRSLGRVEEALAAQQALAAEHVAAGTRDGFVEEEIGECLLALGRAAEAQPHFARAHAALIEDRWLAEAEPARLKRLRRLGAAE